MRIGIMQGRLLPPIDGAIQRFPRDRWQEEFALAAQAELEAIEWIFESYGRKANPLRNGKGIAQIKALSQTHGIAVESVCADYFMDKPFLRVSFSTCEERISDLKWLIAQCARLRVSRIILPFVDVSEIQGAAEMDQVIAVLQSVLPLAEQAAVELHLETSLPPQDFAKLLAHLPHPLVKVNYDAGNSASLGHDPVDEFTAYGGRIGSVHIKDRIRGGTTVPLGTGAAQLKKLFRLLRQTGYKNGFILQVARGEPGKEVNWAIRNRALVEELWAKS